MKKINILTLIVLSLTFTSCYEFSREQHLLDSENNGKAILLEAESSKKAMIEEAKAKNESATLEAEAKVKIAKAEAQAEIERAKGVAEANRIIGESMKGNKEYLEYLKIDAIRNSQGDKIYVPTEAGLPLLEARSK
ncbi:hypothetical protein MHM83_11030 [Tenacibaculum sp. Mcav3-52]|uniref:SPFH domain/Band 7 family protein n=1 Tax=Tenacibaculum caenipelagi TaxID=1325435 RepID=A0A4V3D326_9FLAO|nr:MULTISPECIES: hypothetical protein [Tenacibaculum]MCG7502406.1 hypothetical protein [Tenacibaculum sp. Mcav3-52]TDQ27654.1 hypothetical protein DFQ07_1505 [Tenacibaculum caenipelagi]